jgi:16S rRNA (guanine527-N7)-methyltransferase
MVKPDLIFKHFPELTDFQKEQFEALYPFYLEWNSKINVISRKDIDELYIRHVLHSLTLAKLVDLSYCHEFLDIGTGGGFPGIPLAILYPDKDFHLVDSIGKKINVVKGVAEALGLKNVEAEQARAEQITGKYDIVMCRAVTQLADFYSWITKNLKSDSEVLCLKGGDLTDEIKSFRFQYKNRIIKKHNLHDTFPYEFFETKQLLVISHPK